MLQPQKPIVMGEILPLNFEDCCFRYDLVIGCAIYVTVEVYMWAILSLASIYTEFKMIENHDVSAFKNFSAVSTYYVTVFGNSTNNSIGRAVICELTYNVFLMFSWKVHERRKIPLEQGKVKSIFIYSTFLFQLHKLESMDFSQLESCFTSFFP